MSLFISWQAMFLSIPGTSNCFKRFLGRCQPWRPQFRGERKGSGHRLVYCAQENGLNVSESVINHVRCETRGEGEGLRTVISNTWQLFNTDQHQPSCLLFFQLSTHSHMSTGLTHKDTHTSKSFTKLGFTSWPLSSLYPSLLNRCYIVSCEGCEVAVRNFSFCWCWVNDRAVLSLTYWGSARKGR